MRYHRCRTCSKHIFVNFQIVYIPCTKSEDIKQQLKISTVYLIPGELMHWHTGGGGALRFVTYVLAKG